MIFKKIILSIIFFCSSFAFPQQFDEEFLESLPDEVREDLLNQVQDQNKIEEKQYRRPSTLIEKPEEESDRFGVNIFSMMQSTLMPINEPNFDADYILDFGDMIQLQLVGSKSLITNIPIQRDGSINIPEIGKVVISGMSIENATNLIVKKIETAYIGVNAFVTLSEVRDIQIIVAGNVFNPGLYTLNGNSNVFHGLVASGGPSELGSFRSIDLIRNEEVIESIDLYNIFIFGKPAFGTRLRSGDIIFINKTEKLNGIYGGVKRPGVYELNKNEIVEDLIFFANGFKPEADLSNIVKEVFSAGVVQNIQIDLKDIKNEILDDGENIFVRSYPIRKVQITGAVNNPGTFSLNEGDKLSDLIERAGGYLPNAYQFGGVLENEQALNANIYARDELYRSLLSSIIENSSRMQDYSFDSTGALLEELRESPVSGRVVTEFDLNKLQSNPDKDITLQKGDTVFIPEKINHVYLFGEISNQGTIQYQPNKSVDFYIEQKGGTLSRADLDNIFVLLPNGVSVRVKNKNLFRDGISKVDIYPGSIIFIPRKSDRIILTQSLQAYASILGNLGVSLASLSVIKD
tara:strand:- start:2965 stop:4689 length:1725 start_codon:yes stop_codon:yes gene_type:complete